MPRRACSGASSGWISTCSCCATSHLPGVEGGVGHHPEASEGGEQARQRRGLGAEHPLCLVVGSLREPPDEVIDELVECLPGPGTPHADAVERTVRVVMHPGLGSEALSQVAGERLCRSPLGERRHLDRAIEAFTKVGRELGVIS